MAIICLGIYYLFTVAMSMLNEWVKHDHYDGKNIFSFGIVIIILILVFSAKRGFWYFLYGTDFPFICII